MKENLLRSNFVLHEIHKQQARPQGLLGEGGPLKFNLKNRAVISFYNYRAETSLDRFLILIDVMFLVCRQKAS